MKVLDNAEFDNKLVFDSNNINVAECVDFIMNKFLNSGKKDILILNIGSDRVIGDSFGPLLGSLLKESSSTLNMYGTLDEPVHAVNLKRYIKKIKDINKKTFVIATDVCLTSNLSDIGKVFLQDNPLKPGIALNKNLPSVGDISLVYCCGLADDLAYKRLVNMNLGIIYGVAKEVFKVFSNLENTLSYNNLI